LLSLVRSFTLLVLLERPTASGDRFRRHIFLEPPTTVALTVSNLSPQIVHATIRDQPVGVHELTPKLFAAYDLDGGRVHLGGCSLEDRPLIHRVGATVGTPDEPVALHLCHLDGTIVDNATIEQLHIGELTILEKPPETATAQLVQAAESAAQAIANAGEQGIGEVGIVWSKYARGKLIFTFGDESISRSFAAWASAIAHGDYRPPPVVCPATGEETYRLTSTSDGRIVAQGATATCGVSRKKVLRDELVVCAATGQSVLDECLTTCPVTGERIIESALIRCKQCRQTVSPRTIRAGACGACRQLKPVTTDDPRLARILGEYHRLDRWRNWRIAESDTVYILTATTLFRQLLLVVEKQTLAMKVVATRARLFGQFTDVPDFERSEIASQ
jgi:hypothetical protein